MLRRDPPDIIFSWKNCVKSNTDVHIRFNVAKTLQHIIAVLPSSAQQAQVKPCLDKLNNDSDFDVRYYASEAAMAF